MRRALSLAGALTLIGLMTVFVTWPQAARMSSALIAHQDPYFSVWRLSWIAHALSTSPLHLFDGNVFYPSTSTLLFSDATLLEGVIAAPLLWAGVSPVLVYNLLLLIGYFGSGVAVFVLVRHLTGETVPALIAAAVFTMAPYRTEHVMHLELQWAMFIPMTMWALHRAVEESSRRFAIVAGLCLGLQLLSCVYYGVFFAMTLVVAVPILLLAAGRRAGRAIPNLALGAIVAAVLTLPYLWAYANASQIVGTRSMTELSTYSAHPINYAATSSVSRLWGWTADRWGAPELRLYPGIVAVLLAIAALVSRAKWRVLLYAAITIVAVEMSFGINGTVYGWLAHHVPALLGFRAAARFAIVASFGLAVLAGLGTQALTDRFFAERRAMLAAVLLAAIAIDYANRPLFTTANDLTSVAPVYRVAQSNGPGPIVELPTADPARLPGPDARYAAWSIGHWMPLVNGYSGYYPRDYLRTMTLMRTFPDDPSIARLREERVKYVVVHQALYDDPSAYTQLLLQIARRTELRHLGSYKDPIGNANLFVLD